MSVSATSSQVSTPTAYHASSTTPINSKHSYFSGLSALDALLPVPTLRSQPAATPNNTPTRSTPRRALEETSTNLQTSGSPFSTQGPGGESKELYYGETSSSSSIFDENKTNVLHIQKQKVAKLELRKQNRAEQSRRSSASSACSTSTSSTASSSRKSSSGGLSSIMPYKNYRAKQRKDGDSIWDDEVEEAFMEALRKIPKIGRQKLSIGGTPRGRNELIADYIFKVTGKHRGRKQVSSHIQVLKGHLKDSKEFMSLFAPDDKTNTWEAESNDWDMDSPASPATTLSEPPYTSNIMTTPPARASTHGPSSTALSRGLIGLHSPPPTTHPYSTPTILSNTSSVSSTPSLPVQLRTFRMWVGMQSESGAIIEGCYHTYTSLAQPSLSLTPLTLSTIPEWATRFPYLTEIPLTSDVAIIHAYASVATMASNPPQPSLLCTQLEVSVARSASAWECVTRIYAPGKKVWELAHACPASEDGELATLTLPFASDFWSAFYTALSTSQNSEKADREAVKGITVVQELLVAGGGPRVGLVLWEFTKAEKGRSGKAVWRSVYVEDLQDQQQHELGSQLLGGVADDLGLEAHNTWALNPYEQHGPSPIQQQQELLSPIEGLEPYNFNTPFEDTFHSQSGMGTYYDPGSSQQEHGSLDQSEAEQFEAALKFEGGAQQSAEEQLMNQTWPQGLESVGVGEHEVGGNIDDSGYCDKLGVLVHGHDQGQHYRTDIVEEYGGAHDGSGY